MGVELEFAGLAGIPVYDADLQAEGIPATVTALSDAIRGADGLLIATPEYNYSIPRRPEERHRLGEPASKTSPSTARPLPSLGASMGNLGTARAQYHLRQIFVFLNGLVMNRPEVFVGAVHNKFRRGGQADRRGHKGIPGKLYGLCRRVGGNRSGACGAERRWDG